MLSLEAQERLCPLLGKCYCCHWNPKKGVPFGWKCYCCRWNPRKGVPFGWEVPLLSLEPQEGCSFWLEVLLLSLEPQEGCALWLGIATYCCHWNPRSCVPFGWEVLRTVVTGTPGAVCPLVGKCYVLLSLEPQELCVLWLGSATYCCHWNPRSCVPFGWEVLRTVVTGTPGAVCPLVGKCYVLLSLEPQELCVLWLGSATYCCHWNPRSCVPFGWEVLRTVVTGTPGAVCPLVGKCPCCHWKPKKGCALCLVSATAVTRTPRRVFLLVGSATAVAGTPGRVCPLVGKCPCCHWNPRKGVPFGWKCYCCH